MTRRLAHARRALPPADREELALSEVVTVPDEVVLAEIGTLPAATALLLLEGIDPASLDPYSVLDFLRAADASTRSPQR